ncbi:hypothetical protein HPB47_000855 [Ixodes persulcatus]|uniref:Uncharacterized protein n=1 Tax=Ixodes persulcatus TaxID=34615 RepID=A0AC60PQU5_IXOPE|nr:hypothetical protein HPB47_000855 [Ixodes persulcatus]
MAYGESALAAIDRGNRLTPFAAETKRQHPWSSRWTAAEAAWASLANRVSPILLRHPALRQDDQSAAEKTHRWTSRASPGMCTQCENVARECGTLTERLPNSFGSSGKVEFYGHPSVNNATLPQRLQ